MIIERLFLTWLYRVAKAMSQQLLNFENIKKDK
jgi:hypothetical protein